MIPALILWSGKLRSERKSACIWASKCSDRIILELAAVLTSPSPIAFAEMRKPLAPEIAKIKKICFPLTGKEINQS